MSVKLCNMNSTSHNMEHEENMLADLIADLQSYDVTKAVSSRDLLRSHSQENPQQYSTLYHNHNNNSSRPKTLNSESSSPLSPGLAPPTPPWGPQTGSPLSPGYGPLFSPVMPVDQKFLGLTPSPRSSRVSTGIGSDSGGIV